MRIIEYLEFTHANVSRIALAWIADRQAVVSTRWQFELELDRKVTIFFFRENSTVLR